jgi:hypothetical protein
VLVPLVVAHLAVVAAFATRATHNGWLYSRPGPGLDQWTASWALGHLWAPSLAGSHGLPVVWWPLARAFDGSLPAALPTVVLTQVAIGGTVAVLAMYGIGARIGGRLFGYAAAAGWVVAPLLSLAYFYGGDHEFLGVPYADYRGLVQDVAVTDALGLTSLAGFPSLVALVVAAWLLVRCVDTGAWNDVLLSGLVSGFAIGIEPANVLFLPAPVLALAVARRWRQIAGFAIAVLPALGTLALWRWTALGHVGGFDGLEFRWADFEINLVHLRGAGWSLLLLEWIVVAGAFAVVRKAPAKGVLVAAWFACFFVANSGDLARARVLDGGLFRLIEAGYPAFVLLVAALLFLVPTWGRRRIEARAPTVGPRLTRGLVAATIVLAIYPLALVVLAGPTPLDRVVVLQKRDTSVPVSDEFRLQVVHRDGQASLRWREPPAGATTLSYRIFRSPGGGCAHRDGRGGDDCLLRMAGAATVRGTAWTDPEPEPGQFVYRVAALADYRPDRVGGELLLISPAAR